MPFTPSDIEVLLHCHYGAEAHPRYEAPAVREGIAKLSRLDLIERTTDRPSVTNPRPNLWITTPRGRAHVAQICYLALPVEKSHWVGADGKVIAF